MHFAQFNSMSKATIKTEIRVKQKNAFDNHVGINAAETTKHCPLNSVCDVTIFRSLKLFQKLLMSSIIFTTMRSQSLLQLLTNDTHLQSAYTIMTSQ